MQVGDQFESKRWGTFIIDKEKGGGKEFRVKFLRTNNAIWVKRKKFVEGKFLDVRQSHVCGVGYNNYDRHESYFDAIERYWRQMLRRCYTQKTHSMCKEWTDFRLFYRFLNNPKNEDLHIAITTGVLVAPRYHFYSPETMIIVPNASVWRPRMVPQDMFKRTYPKGEIPESAYNHPDNVYI